MGDQINCEKFKNIYPQFISWMNKSKNKMKMYIVASQTAIAI